MKVASEARSEVDQYLAERDEEVKERELLDDDAAAQVAVTDAFDWHKEREDWRRYVDLESDARMLSADEWLELMLDNVYFTGDELESDYQTRRSQDCSSQDFWYEEDDYFSLMSLHYGDL